MEIITLEIPEVKVVKPQIFADERGYFYESYNKEKFIAAGIDLEFVQDNQSLSGKNILRGLHLQEPPFVQGKLVRVIKGAVLDVAVDLRKQSPYFGKWVSQKLTEENKLMMWLPPGFAHGFLTLEDNTIFSYKCTAFYNHQSERVIQWNDADLGINWGVDNPVLSERDRKAILFKNYKSLF